MLKTNIAGVDLNTCIYNASGVNCTFDYELKTLASSAYIPAVITKSCTLNPREGNEKPRYHGVGNRNISISINSTGLHNLGYKFYNELASEIVQYGKPYMISVAGLSQEENLIILKDVVKNDKISLVELNLSCPNIIGKPQTGYDFEATDELLSKVFEFYDKPLGLKLPPYFDMVHFETMASIIQKYPLIKFITCINSLGNGLIVDSDKERVTIKPKNGFGGVGGAGIKPFALSNVHQFYRLLGDNVDIVGCGGVMTGDDVFQHILVGAKAVQVGTRLKEYGMGCMEILNKELEEIMKLKNYQTIEDFRGKLKYLS